MPTSLTSNTRNAKGAHRRKAIAQVRGIKATSRVKVALRSQQRGGYPRDKTQSFLAVGGGASAGGLEAFTQLPGARPAQPGMAFMLVQHLDPQPPSMLTDILSKTS